MSLREQFVRQVAIRTVSSCLTGKPKDLRKLLAIEKFSLKNWGMSAFPFNESANLRRPCMIIDNPGVLRQLVAEHMVPQGHDHAEDLIKDPAVVEWIDGYARHLEELTEPDWRRRIEDPAFRWHKEKEEYKLLFRFKGSSY